jgi:tetratricopeptide (TPR) repeat protein
VSSLAGPLSREQRRTVTIPLPHVLGNAGVGTLVAVAVAASAFVAAGGLRLERTTDVLIAMMLAGGGLVAAALVLKPRTADLPFYGGVPLLAFGLLAAFTAFSVMWSLAPSDSWLEANRTFAYLAVFAGGIALARLASQRWSAVLMGVGAGCLIVSAWALTTKVFPASLAADETYARLREPFAYWNSVGLMAAVGLPPMLWLAARRSGHAAVNALAWPAMGLLIVCLMLAYSRGALVAVVAGLALWFVVVPLRLRALVPFLGALVGAAPVVAWAFAQDGLTTDDAPMAARVDAGHEFGALLILMLAVLLVAGLAVHFTAAVRPPTAHQRRLAGRAALALLALVPVLALIALASAPGGVDGQVSKAWNQLTDPKAALPSNSPDRLTATSSVRARYWDEALDVHALEPWIGTGAGAYATVRTRFRDDTLAVRHAHGYVVQTLADLGWAGLALSLFAALAWLIAAARAVGLRRRDRGLPYDAERIGMLTLVAVVAVFAVHSAVDWTWFVPANAGVALLCAGWVVGRGPLRARLEAPAAAAAATPTWSHPSRLARLRRRVPPLRALGAALVLVIALAAAWTAFQPVRALHAGDEAFVALDQGNPDLAAAIAQVAVDRNPLSVDPLFELSAMEQARGRTAEAEAALERAVRLQPADAEAWRRLGRFRLDVLNDAPGALTAFRAAYSLDPASATSVSDVLEATRATQAPTPESPTP